MSGELPTVENIDVPLLGLTMVDQDNVPQDVGRRSREIMREVLEEQVLGVVRPNQPLCGTEQPEHENRLYARALTINPRLTYEAFVAAAGDAIVADDAMCDPRLSLKTLVAMDANRVNHGLFIMYNIEIEQLTPTQTVASAMAMPGVRAPRGFTLRATWSAIMRTILAEDLHFGPLRVLDIIEWRFPQREGHRWKEAQVVDGISGDLVVQDVSIGNDLTKTPDDVPEKIRRRPPAPRGR